MFLETTLYCGGFDGLIAEIVIGRPADRTSARLVRLLFRFMWFGLCPHLLCHVEYAGIDFKFVSESPTLVAKQNDLTVQFPQTSKALTASRRRSPISAPLNLPAPHLKNKQQQCQHQTSVSSTSTTYTTFNRGAPSRR